MNDSIVGGAKIVGKGIPKADSRSKASGEARFAGDVRPSKRGSLCGRILRSPFPHASIVSIDTSEAAALKGVYAVITGEDVTPARIGRFLKDRTVLARGKVRFVGEPVAAVAAADEGTAEAALSLIRVEYKPLPVVFTPEDALAPGAPVIHEDLASYEDLTPSRREGNQRNLIRIERGDVDAAFQQADIVVEGTYTVQPVHQGFIEPKACVAAVDKDGKVTVWPSNKGPFLNRAMISRGLGLPLSKVRVVSPTLGGDFGGKGAPTIEPICALLAIRAGLPVRIALSAQEELATNFLRHPGVIRLSVAANKDGKLLGVQGEVIYNCGAYCDGIFGMAHSCSSLQGAYGVPAVRLVGRSVFTNSIPAGHVRAPGAPQTLFAIESLIDEVARRAGLDPFEIRRRNALREGDQAPDGKGVMGSNGLVETIDRVAQSVERDNRRREPNQGLGVASGGWHMTGFGDALATKTVLKLNEDGSAVLLTGIPDNGAGQHIALSQIVAEVLGLKPEEVTVVGGDTELTPFDAGPGGSRGTLRVGLATKFAAEDARRQLCELAASKLEANVQDLDVGGRRVYVKGTPERAVPIAALAGAALASPKGAVVGLGTAEREQWMAGARGRGKIVDESSFCTHAVQVGVDRDTGQVSVLKYVAAQDVGSALNPLSVEGQIQGAVVAGLGYALTEEIVIEEGKVANPSHANYLLPAADVAPPVQAIIVEQPSAMGVYGARGVGETSITPVAAAIANAVYDAVGVRIRDLPITPEKVLRALQEK